MREITIKISEEDYRDLMRHTADNSLGRPLVAVYELVGVSKEDAKAWVEGQKEMEEASYGPTPLG